MVDTDVIVVGGGPAGAATATFLAREGVGVTLLDRARFPRNKPCAEFLSPQTGRLLQSLGVLPAVQAQAVPLSGMEVRAPSGAKIVGDYGAVHGFTPFQPNGLAITRLTFDNMLLQGARDAGVRIVENTRVSDVGRDESGNVTGVRALGADGQEQLHPARLVVGADGLRSIIARRIARARQRSWPSRMAFVAHYRHVSGVRSRGEMLVEPGGYLGIAAVSGGVTNVSLVVERGLFAGKRVSPAKLMDDWIARHSHIRERFIHAQRVDDIQATGPFASRARQAWAPRVALVGDAADFFDPFTGEGIYSALLGAEALGHFAARALREAKVDALREYDGWRYAEFAAKWRVEWLIGLAVARPWLLERAARAFARRPDLGHKLIGVTGDFVPAREVLKAGYLAQLLMAMMSFDAVSRESKAQL